VEASDEAVITAAVGALFPKNPAVTTALKVQAASQLRELAGYVLKQSQEAQVRHRAEALLAFAGRLIAVG
jgi:hypothetical protein